MPRDGAGIYTTPAGTHGVSGATIYSAAYNANVDDVATDLNTPRPVVAGGTGASSPSAACSNLGAVAKAGDTMTGNLTLNYADPQLSLDKTGSGHNNIIQSYTNHVPRWQILLGNATPETGGNAGSDFQITAFNDSGSGLWTPLTINRANGRATFDQIAGFNSGINVVGAQSSFSYNGASGWNIWVSTGATGNGLIVSGGSSSGGTCALFRTYDAGTNIFGLNYNSVQCYQPLNANSGITSHGDIHADRNNDQGVIYLGNSSTHYLFYDGTQFQLNGGQILINDQLHARGGTIYVGSGDNAYIQYGSGYLYLGGAQTNVQNALTVSAGGADISGKVWHRGSNVGDWGSIFTAPGYGLMIQASTGSGDYVFQCNNAANSIVLFSVRGDGVGTIAGNFAGAASASFASNLQIGAQGYKPGGGAWADSSDSRIKNVIGDYTLGLDEVLQLRPVKYTFKGNDTIGPPSDSTTPPPDPLQGTPATQETPTVPYANSPHYHAAVAGTEFVGMIAQEVEAVMPGMVTHNEGYIDGAFARNIRDLNTTELIYTLVNAIKTLNTRIAALEAR